MAPTRWQSAAWLGLAWGLFGAAYVGGIVFVASGLDAGVGAVVLVVTAGQRLSQYVFYSDFPLETSDPLFRELEDLPEQLQRELHLPMSQA